LKQPIIAVFQFEINFIQIFGISGLFIYYFSTCFGGIRGIDFSSGF
jgi:hypothetical protein